MSRASKVTLARNIRVKPLRWRYSVHGNASRTFACYVSLYDHYDITSDDYYGLAGPTRFRVANYLTSGGNTFKVTKTLAAAKAAAKAHWQAFIRQAIACNRQADSALT